MPEKRCLGCHEPLAGILGTIVLCGACMFPAAMVHKVTPFDHGVPALHSYAVGAAIPEPPDQPHVPGLDSIGQVPGAEYSGTAQHPARNRGGVLWLRPYSGPGT
jgi:hypothetical protein